MRGAPDAPPNILYLHSHDTGRWVQPYGHAVPTPNIQKLAEEGVLFRQAFCAAPTCSGSRACLLTGQYAHSNGMVGLAHRGFSLRDYRHHIVHTLRRIGYWSALIGEQHISKKPEVIGYDEVFKIPTNHTDDVVPVTLELLSRDHGRPFFLSVGFFETHREFFRPSSPRKANYVLPPPNLPDTPETRLDMAAFCESARSLDRGVGAVLDALDATGLAENTLVICTTDHGIAFPGCKATLYDRGLGVMLILRGPGGFSGGRTVDALVSHIDIFPTVCELVGIEHPPWLQGESLLPLVRGEAEEIRDAIFAEKTYHVAYEPQRCVRTRRWKYIRRFDDRSTPVLANTDDGPSKELLLRHGWAERPVPEEQLYDLLFDPNEACNLAGDPAHAPVLREMRARLERWMRSTEDPILDGPILPPPGAELNLQDQRSPKDPTVRV
ncbi:Ulvan-active sulfatase [Rubrobacter xylanophilus DSM 9941]|uniref:sulfatase family protein n=1 Tax=Rubrobacter xylanophilus TaxID=49319 RepID=UPI001C643947|nr:sulfatase [Rubrobacter xylanophilus]QYJ17261.1 Ulvan-active sulfatase [Rubrobacter xylanophilus DSM 9941]